MTSHSMSPAGTPELDCEDNTEPNVTCDFNRGVCGYTSEATQGDAVWTHSEFSLVRNADPGTCFFQLNVRKRPKVG